MRIIQKIAEEKIRKAIAKGEFNDLPAHGQPYRFDGYLFEDPEKRIQRKLLKDHNFQPLPLALRKKIDTQLAHIEHLIEFYRREYARRLEMMARIGRIELAYPPQQYWEYPQHHLRFIRHYLPIWMKVKTDSRFQKAVREFKEVRNRALFTLRHSVRELLDLIEEYDEEMIKLCIQERDFFRVETGFGVKQFYGWMNYFETLFPAMEEDGST